jgi:hypothetical protein
MLITVKRLKLVLGRTVYLRGDVFECRDAEARLLVASGMAVRSPDGTKVTKGSPTPPTTGMSVKPGTQPASKEIAAPRVDSRGRAADPVPVAPARVPQAQMQTPFTQTPTHKLESVEETSKLSTSSSFKPVPADSPKA